jgi:hypothetical protein
MSPITLGVLAASSVRMPDLIDYLVIAGGGGGGNDQPNNGTGGGGAGGYRTSVGTSGRGSSAESTFAVASTNYTVTVGAGGPGIPLGGGDGGSGRGDGTQGSNSIFATITSIGGGYGAAGNNAGGGNGGSGGGGGTFFSTNPLGGSGTANQGYDAANGNGGGGAGAGGTSSSHTPGIGIESSITGTAVKRAGGGRGSPDIYYQEPKTIWGGGGTNYQDQNGTANTGAGGGAGNGGKTIGGSGNGGSGVVVLRYMSKFTKLKVGAGLTYSYTDNGTYKIYTFTAGTGNISWE